MLCVCECVNEQEINIFHTQFLDGFLLYFHMFLLLLFNVEKHNNNIKLKCHYSGGESDDMDF